MKPSEIIIAAKQLIITKGWIKNNYITDKGYCLTGSLSYACEAKDRTEFYKACAIVSKVIDPSQPQAMHYKLEEYNDLPYRTLEHILEVLDKSLVVALKSEV